MNTYFTLSDIKEFFQDDKLSRFIWRRADHYIQETKRFRRHQAVPIKHKDVNLLEKHFKACPYAPKSTKRSRAMAEVNLEIIMPQMEAFKKHVASLDI